MMGNYSLRCFHCQQEIPYTVSQPTRCPYCHADPRYSTVEGENLSALASSVGGLWPLIRFCLWAFVVFCAVMFTRDFIADTWFMNLLEWVWAGWCWLPFWAECVIALLVLGWFNRPRTY